jgi:hypothetical protein
VPISRREAALAAFKTQLETLNTPTQVATVARNVRDAVTAPPAVVMVDGGERKNEDGESFLEDRYTLRVSVYGYVQAATDEQLGGEISELRAKIVAAVLADPFLAGAAEYVREAPDAMDNPDYDEERGRKPSAAMMVNFEVEYTTAKGNPYAGPS